MKCGGSGEVETVRGEYHKLIGSKPCPGCDACKGSGELPVDMAAIGLPEYSEHEGSMLCSTCDGSGVKS